jgi:histidyl-tRNA synthetase
VLLNSVGHAGCRPAYAEKLRAYLAPFKDSLCADCQVRFEKNPLRVLDCKVPHDKQVAQGIPSILDSLCDDCRTHFDAVRKGLDALGVAYELDPKLVRGLDYYTRTAFEVHDLARGAQSALGGGGRYDGLVEDIGGPSVPGVGFSAGLERILIALTEQGKLPAAKADGVFVARMGGEAVEAAALALVRRLRQTMPVTFDFESAKSLGAQLKQADKAGARWAVILGEDELAAGEATVKDLQAGAQERVALAKLTDHLTTNRENAR